MDITKRINAIIEGDITVREMTDDGGYGVVRYERRKHVLGGEVEHIVHRWATLDTAGQPMANGFHLWSGLYTLDEDAARADYDKRRQL